MTLLTYINHSYHDIESVIFDIKYVFQQKKNIIRDQCEKPICSILQVYTFFYEIYDIEYNMYEGQTPIISNIFPTIYYKKGGHFYFTFALDENGERLFKIVGGERDGEIHKFSHIARIAGCRDNHKLSIIDAILKNNSVKTSQTSREFFVYSFG